MTTFGHSKHVFHLDKSLYYERSLILKLCVAFTILSYGAFAQVGINTTTPNGMLEVNSSTSGIVFPRVALTATNVAAPVVNPNGGGAPVVGTTVFNTNATTTGSNDVYVGKYYWDGSQWVAQFDRRQSQLFEQDRTISGANPNNDFVGFRVSASAGYENIYGLTAQTFTATYTGTYKVEATINYGPGTVMPPTIGNMTAIAGQGMFRLTFDGTNYEKYMNPITMYNNAYSAQPAQDYFALYNESNIIVYVTLTAGQTYNFNLSFDQWPDTRLTNGGNSGTGRGAVGVLSPCKIEITYLED